MKCQYLSIRVLKPISLVLEYKKNDKNRVPEMNAQTRTHLKKPIYLDFQV